MGIERLFRYGARPPFAQDRISVRYYRLTDMQCALGISQLAKQSMWLRRRRDIAGLYRERIRARLGGLVTPQAQPLDRESAHPLRSAIVPAAVRTQPAVCGASTRQPHTPQSKTTKPSSRVSGAQLLLRVFAMDVLQCDNCSAPMRIVAFIQDSQTAHQILDYLGLEMCNVQSTGPPNDLSTERYR